MKANTEELKYQVCEHERNTLSCSKGLKSSQLTHNKCNTDSGNEEKCFIPILT